MGGMTKRAQGAQEEAAEAEQARIDEMADRAAAEAPLAAWRRAVVVLDRQTPHPPSSPQPPQE